MSKENYHRSVLNSKVLEALNVLPNEVYLDATLGGAGHTEGILKSAGKVVAIDVDKHAIEHAKEKFGLVENDGVWVTRNSNLKIIKANFKDLDKVLEKLAVKEVSGILFDLGVSSHMFDSPERGFSFSKIGPLDMRMDQSLQVTAEDLVNGLNEGELYELFTRLGEVVNGRSIARNIVRSRVEKKITTTTELAEIVNKHTKRKKGEIDPSTKVFMALRIAVNDEINALKEALPKAYEALKEGGRLVVLSFHSLEDKVVKEFFKNNQGLKVLTDKPIEATKEEIEENRRARSVKMRVATKIVSN